VGNVLDKGGFEFPEYTFTVERGKIKEFVQAIGDDNPLYTDREYAAGQGYRDIIAPPTFGVCVDMWGGPGFDELCAKLEVNPVMVLHGEQEFEYFGEINSGDELTASPRVVKVAQKRGNPVA